MMALLVLLLVGAPRDNGGPQRSQETKFALAQSVQAQSAPAGQIPTCQQILREFESDPRTQQASPEAAVRAGLRAGVRAGSAG